jgi:hypothetical protein
MNIDTALADLRWRSDDPDVNSDALLRLIANYPSYWLVMVDGKLPNAPDNKGRTLVPVFTSDEARNRFLDSLAPAMNQKTVTPVGGPDLFAQLADMALDGIVFNCAGPEQPIAFVPALATLALRYVVAPGAPDFDALIVAAAAEDTEHTKDANDALWRALFALPEWVFVGKPDHTGPSVPTIINQGKRRTFAFTDRARAALFSRENNLHGQNGQAVTVSKSPVDVVDWLTNSSTSNGVEVLHINFGGQGYYIPAANLPKIRKRLFG